MLKEFEATTRDGDIVRVPMHAEFSMRIDGAVFNFVVHDRLDAVGKAISHKESGLLVRVLGVTDAELRGYVKLRTDEERARYILKGLIERVGAKRVREAIEQRRVK